MAAITAAVVAGLAVGAVGASMMGGDGDSPEPRNYAQETRDALQAQIDLAPQQYAAEAEFRPKYNALELRELEAMLFGRPGGTREETYTDFVEREIRGTGGQGMYITQPWHPDGRVPQLGTNPESQFERVPVTRTRTVSEPGQRGLLDMIETDLGPALRRIQSADRAAEIGDVARLGPESMKALRLSNPGGASIVDKLVEQANANLDGGLSAGEQRGLEQQVRSSQAARGVGFGPSDLYEEIYEAGVGGQELIRRRGMEALAASSSFYGDPFERILARPGVGASAGGQQQGFAAALGGGSGSRLFNPESAYAADLFGTNFNSAAAAKISANNNRAALIGSLIGGAGAVGGGYLAGRN